MNGPKGAQPENSRDANRNTPQGVTNDLGRERILTALRASLGKSLHVMEVLQLLGAPKDQKERLRDVLVSLRELGFVKELPGNRFRLIPEGQRKKKPGSSPQLHPARMASATASATGAARSSSPEPQDDVDDEERQALAAPLEEPSSSTNKSPASLRYAAQKEERRSRRLDAMREQPMESSPQRNEQTGNPYYEGVVSMTPRGFAFVSTDEGPKEDVFVGLRNLGPAIHGDRVLLEVQKSPKGFEGRVHSILQRRMTRVAGRLKKTSRGFEMVLGDPRLPPSLYVDGELPLGAKEGLEVIASVSHYPRFPGEAMRGRVVEVLGPRGKAHVEVEKIKLRENIVEPFPEDVLIEASAYPTEIREEEWLFEGSDRVDFRHLPFLTIDPHDAKDHDDALCVIREDDGYRVIVAIADVSEYVKEGSAIDREAIARGCSIYLPDRAIPMLPGEISSNLASLVPGEDRFTLAVDLTLGPQGGIRKRRFVQGVIRSRCRLNYEGVARALGLSELATEQPEALEFMDSLRDLHHLSNVLRAKRKRRGSIDFDLPEGRVKLDPKGEPIDVAVPRNDPGIKRSYGIVEDFMLLANEVVAEFFATASIPTLYRVHGKPDLQKVARFIALCQSLGLARPDEDFEKPKNLSRLLTRVEGSPYAHALSYLLLRSMQQASYQVDNIGHFALAARNYLHFTSPIRRYPDLVVHRELKALLQDRQARAQLQSPKFSKQISLLARQSSRNERRAMIVERDVVDVYRALLMKKHEGEIFEGSVTGVHEQFLFVTIDAPYVEVKIPLERVSNEPMRLDPFGIRLISSRSNFEITLGERIQVRIVRVSVEDREILAEPVSASEAAPHNDENSQQARKSKPPNKSKKSYAVATTKPQNEKQKSSNTRGDSAGRSDRKKTRRK